MIVDNQGQIANDESKVINTEAGFTIIEMIIYIAIISIFLTAVSLLMLEIISGRGKIVVSQEVQQNLRLANSLISQDVIAAQDITSPTAGNSSNTLILDNGPDDLITYTITNGILTRQVGAASPVNVTSDIVTTTPVFENLSYNDRSRSVGVSLQIDFLNPTGSSNFDASASITKSIELKERR